MTPLENLANTLFLLFDVYIIVRFYNHAFVKKQESPGIKACRGLLVIAVLAALALIFHIRLFPYITVPASFTLLGGYRRDRQRKLLVGSVLLSVPIYWLGLYDIVTRLLPHPETPTPLTSFLYSLFIWLVYRIGLFALYEILRRTTSSQSHPIPSNMWFMLLTIPVICLIAYIICYFTAIYQMPRAWTAMVIPLSLAMLFISSILMMLYDSLASLVLVTKENTLLDQQLQTQNQYYERLDATQQQIASVHHDMKNHLRTASLLAEKSADNTELIGYLDTVANQIDGVAAVVSTGNPGLDFILNIKLAELAAADICTDMQTHIPPGIQMTFEEAVVVFGNLLDNAREACMALEPAQRFVSIMLSYANEMLFIQIENSAAAVTNWLDGLPQSTKADPLFHGLGLKNVRKLVEKNGSMLMKSEGGSFAVTITLYNR